MPEDQARLGVLDDGASGEVLKDEVVQCGGVSSRYMQQVVRSPGDVKNLDHTGQVGGNGDERLDLFPVMGLHAHGDDGLYGQADKGQVDVGVVAPDDAAFTQCPNPPQTR